MTKTVQEIRESDRKYQIHSLHHPVDVADSVIYAEGQGVMLRDIDGNEYIDGLSALWNVNIGHGRQEMAETAAEQMKRLAYFSGYAGSSSLPSIALAERLIQLAPNMAGVYFCSGGGEANEVAFKTARYFWKVQGRPEKRKIISRFHAYHGATLQAMSATGISAYWKMFEPRVPGFLHIQTCYPYRFQGASDGETVGQAAARELEEMILREGAETIAAFIGEPIHGAGGVIYPTEDYWPLVREVCSRHQVLLIADEIITGFGRTGRWWGLEHWAVTPDIVSFAKGITSGYLPLGGIMLHSEIRNALESVQPTSRWMHGYTNSGHPTCCAVALKNIEIIERENLRQNSARMGNLLFSRLKEELGNHPHVGDIRGGKGLLAAVEFVKDRSTRENFDASIGIGPQIQSEMRKRGIITRSRKTEGTHPAPGDQILFAPPLIIQEVELNKMINALCDSVESILGSKSSI